MDLVLKGSVVWSGMDQIIAKIEDGGRTIPRDTAGHINRVGQLTSPVDTGELVMSHRFFQVAPQVWHQKVGAKHGLYVNFGTRNMAAQPWWSAAVASGQTYMAGRVRTWLR